MRWMLSLTASSGRPTSTVLGKPAEASTSTSTGTASIPTSAKVLSLASIARDPVVSGAEKWKIEDCQFPIFNLLSALHALGRHRMQNQAFDGEPGAEEHDEQGEDYPPQPHGPGREHPPGVLVLLGDGVQRDEEKNDEADHRQDHHGADDARQQPKKDLAARRLVQDARLDSHPRLGVVAAVQADNGILA